MLSSPMFAKTRSRLFSANRREPGTGGGGPSPSRPAALPAGIPAPPLLRLAVRREAWLRDWLRGGGGLTWRGRRAGQLGSARDRGGGRAGTWIEALERELPRCPWSWSYVPDAGWAGSTRASSLPRSARTTRATWTWPSA
jgi:hypothetical protein